jgi:putative ABC transport system permease protein
MQMKFDIFKKNDQLSEKKVKESWKETHSGISTHIILFIGWRNLKAGKFRSVLTIGGVALGIGVITFLLCMGFGVQRLIVNEVTKNNPLNVIDINNGSLDNFISLNDEVVERIKNIEGVGKVERRVNTGGKVIAGESQTDVVVFGANEGYFDLAKIYYRQNEGAFKSNENKVIISEQVAKLLGYNDPIAAVGNVISYNVVISKEVSSQINEERVSDNQDTEIVGVILGDNDAYIYLPFDILKETFQIDMAQSGKVLVNDMERFDAIKQQLEQIGFVTESINDLIKDIDNFFNTMRIALVVFGVIIMSISVMGMLNTLSVSLLQRTKEIGILKALGSKRSDIFKMFVFESVIISLVGGLLGLLGGFGFSFLINEILIILGKKNGVELTFFVYIPVYFIVAIGGFILFMGFVTGLMPAFRASRIHALEALRYE